MSAMNPSESLSREVALVRQSAQGGDIASMYKPGKYILEGNGIERNPSEAVSGSEKQPRAVMPREWLSLVHTTVRALARRKVPRRLSCGTKKVPKAAISRVCKILHCAMRTALARRKIPRRLSCGTKKAPRAVMPRECIILHCAMKTALAHRRMSLLRHIGARGQRAYRVHVTDDS